MSIWADSWNPHTMPASLDETTESKRVVKIEMVSPYDQIARDDQELADVIDGLRNGSPLEKLIKASRDIAVIACTEATDVLAPVRFRLERIAADIDATIEDEVVALVALETLVRSVRLAAERDRQQFAQDVTRQLDEIDSTGQGHDGLVVESARRFTLAESIRALIDDLDSERASMKEWSYERLSDSDSNPADVQALVRDVEETLTDREERYNNALANVLVDAEYKKSAAEQIAPAIESVTASAEELIQKLLSAQDAHFKVTLMSRMSERHFEGEAPKRNIITRLFSRTNVRDIR